MGANTPRGCNGGLDRKINPRKNDVKDDLALFLVMLAQNEHQASLEDMRELFIGHWERGIESLLQFHQGEDWVQLLNRLMQTSN